MSDATLGIASDFVRSGMEKTGIPLTQTLEHYLSITFARFIGRAIRADMLTVRIARAMEETAPRDVLRALADECLIACALFEERLRRAASRSGFQTTAWPGPCSLRRPAFAAPPRRT